MNAEEIQHRALCCQRFPAFVCSSIGIMPSSSPAGTSNGPLTDDDATHRPLFDLMQVIGTGSTSVVYLAKRLYPGPTHREASLVAIKIVDLEKRSDAERRRCFTEVECLSMCSCFSVLRDHGDFRYPPDATDLRHVLSLAIVADYANSGDLRREIKARRRANNPFTEHQVALMFLQIVMAMRYIHDHRILHRDIKTANILLCSNGLVKLADFGLSKMWDLPPNLVGTADHQDVGGAATAAGSPQVPQTPMVAWDVFCGTPYYIAPEVWMRKPYGVESDMYSLGVVLFETMALQRPFESDSIEVLRDAVLDGALPGPVVDRLRQDYPNLVPIALGLLEIDASKRLSAEDVLKLPLMRLAASTLLQIAHNDATEIATADRERMVRGIRRLSYTAAGYHRGSGYQKRSHRSTTGSPSCKKPSGSGTMLGSPSTSRRTSGSTSVSTASASSPVRSASFAWSSRNELSPTASKNSFDSRKLQTIIKEGFVWKDANKRRYLYLSWLPVDEGCEYDPEDCVDEVGLVVAADAQDPRGAKRLLREFEDVFPLPLAADASNEPTSAHGFALMLNDGKRLVFRCDDAAGRDDWVHQLEGAFRLL